MWGRLSLLDTWNLQVCETLTAHSPKPRGWTSSQKPPVCVQHHAFRGERSSAARMSRGVISSHSGDLNPCFQRFCLLPWLMGGLCLLPRVAVIVSHQSLFNKGEVPLDQS